MAVDVVLAPVGTEQGIIWFALDLVTIERD